MYTENEINKPDQQTGRRGFLSQAFFSVAGAVAAGAILSPAAFAKGVPGSYHDIPTPKILNLPFLKAADDVKVLNYALLLEDLESDLYVQAVQRLTTGGTNAIGKTIPGLGYGPADEDVAYMTEFAAVELQHRDFLRNSLNSLFSGLPIHEYKHDFQIENMGRADVLNMVLTVEATGVKAYLGAITKLKTREFITAAAAIQGTEARHTAVLTAVQNHLFNGSSPKPVAPLPGDNHGADSALDPDTVLGMVQKYLVA